jgi:hypothetical protein
MIARSVGGNIQISRHQGLSLQPGEVVSIHVLKRLDVNKWAVAILGRVYPARSSLALEAGAHLQARVSASARHLVLSLEAQSPGQAAALLRQGLPAGPLPELAAASLLSTGRPVSPEALEKMRLALSRTPLRKDRAAKAFATLLDKGIDILSPGAERLVREISFGQGQEGDGRRRRGRDLPRSAEEVRRAFLSMAAADPRGAGVIAAYNHLRGRGQNWVVLPFLFTDGDDEYPGTMKILFDPFARRPLAFALSVSPKGGADISFHAALQGEGGRRMRLFCSEPGLRRRAARSLGVFAAKLGNLGFEVDDTIHGGEEFDGFSPAGEGASLRGVDAVG